MTSAPRVRVGDRPPLVTHPGDDVVPAQRAGLLRPQAREKRQGDAGLQPGAPGGIHHSDRLVQGERFRRPPGTLPLGRLDQRSDVAHDQAVPLGVADGPGQHVARDLYRPGGHLRRQRGERALDVARRQIPQPHRAELRSQHRRDRVPVETHGLRGRTVQPTRQPVVERVVDGVGAARPQAVVDLLVQLPELVADLGLGAAADLLRMRVRAGLKPRSVARCTGSAMRPSRSSPRRARDACPQPAS
jgi:hypothetical protein